MKLDSCIRVGVADDHELVRKGLAALLNEKKHVEVVLLAENGRDLMNQLKTTPCDLVLMDLEMPVLNGVEALLELREIRPGLPVVVLSMNTELYSIAEALQAGAVAFLPKDVDESLLLDVIKSVVKSKEISLELYHRIYQETGIDLRCENILSNLCLTEREKEIIELVCAGKKNKEIAETLFISKRTVEGHRNSIAQKTETSNIAELVVFALKNRLFSLN